MPQLQAVGARVHFPQGRGGGVVVLVGAVGVIGEGQQLLLAVVRQIEGHDLGGPLLIGGVNQAVEEVRPNLGNGLRRQQAAVPGEAQLHRLGTAGPQGPVSGA